MLALATAVAAVTVVAVGVVVVGAGVPATAAAAVAAAAAEPAAAAAHDGDDGAVKRDPVQCKLAHPMESLVGVRVLLRRIPQGPLSPAMRAASGPMVWRLWIAAD